MPTRDEIYTAIRNADAAGDSASVQKLAAFLQTMGGKSKAQQDTEAWQKTIDPTDGMSTFDKAVAGYGKAGADLVQGVKQIGAGVADFFSPREQGVSSLVTGKKTPSRIDELRAEVAESRRLDAPLMKTGAGTVGNVAGNVAALLPTAFIPGAATIPGAAAIGAATGAVAPSTGTRETLTNTGLGALAAPAGVLAGRAIGAAYQGGKALLEPFYGAGRDRIAGRVLQEFAADPAAVAAASGKTGPSLTGSQPTLAEAARDPGIATLERSLAQQDPKIAAQIAQRAADNNAARVGVVERLAGTDAERAAAEGARKAASENAYGAATRATYTVDDKLADLLKRPAVQQAMERAKTMAANQGRPFAFDVESRTGLGGLGNQSAQTSRQITGQGLQDLKMALDDMLSDPASGFAGKAGGVVKDLRSQIVGWMEGANPEFKAARTAYAETSKPINAMDVGKRLLDKTTANIRDLSGNQRLQANAFARALNDEQSLVRQATGFRGANALEDVLSPQQQAGLNAVRDELELSANLASAANGPGSQTAKALASQNLLRRLLGPTGMPQSWSESAMLQGAMRPVQFAMKTAEPKIQNRLAEVMLNPEQAAAVMEMARVLPLSSRLGAASQPYLPQLGTNALVDAVARRQN